MSVALITGGQQGIGLGIAQTLRDAGFQIAIAAEQPEDAPAVQQALAALGPQARYYRHDLARIEDVPALLDAVTFRRIYCELLPFRLSQTCRRSSRLQRVFCGLNYG